MKQLSENEFIEILIKKQFDNDLVFFAGAGISIDSGLPSIEKLKEIAGININKFNDCSAMKVIFWKNLMSKFTYNINHLSILKLLEFDYFNTILTSNYDLFFEECINQEYKHFGKIKVVGEKEDIPSIELISKIFYGERKLIKVHGDIDTKYVNNIKLDLGTGAEIDGISGIMDGIFSEHGRKNLWIMGYSGKKDDSAMKQIKRLIKENRIENLYWTYLDDNELDNINEVMNSYDKLSFIKIGGANEFFNNLFDTLSIERPQAISRHCSEFTLFISGDKKESFLQLLNENEIEFKANGDFFTISTKIFDFHEKHGIKGLIREQVLFESYKVAMNLNHLISNFGKQVDIFEAFTEAEEKFGKVLKPKNELSVDENFLYILRRFNSYTPILPIKKPESKGGGYFITYDGLGIVIDPGYDFIQNLFDIKNTRFDREFGLNNIDYILITHGHNDHYGDLDALQNLFFQYNKRISTYKEVQMYIEKILYLHTNNNKINGHNISEVVISIRNALFVIFDEFPDSELKEVLLGTLSGIENKSPCMKSITYLKDIASKNYEKKKIELLLSRSAFEAVKSMMPLNKTSYERVLLLNRNDEISLGNNKIRVEVIGAKHTDLYSDSHSVGLKFYLGSVIVGFTGDTGYYKGLEDGFVDCDILIPHIGSIKRKEFSLYKDGVPVHEEIQKNFIIPRYGDGSTNSIYYENHLGVLGITTLITAIEANPNNRLKKVIISEYGEEMKVIRKELTDFLSGMFTNINVLTGDIGLVINLNDISKEIYEYYACTDKNSEEFKSEIYYSNEKIIDDVFNKNIQNNDAKRK